MSPVPLHLRELLHVRELRAAGFRAGAPSRRNGSSGTSSRPTSSRNDEARRILLQRAGLLAPAAVSEGGDRQHRRRAEDERDGRDRARREPALPSRLRLESPLPRGREPRLDRLRENGSNARERGELERETENGPAAARETRARRCRTTPRYASSSWCDALRQAVPVPCDARSTYSPPRAARSLVILDAARAEPALTRPVSLRRPCPSLAPGSRSPRCRSASRA